MRALVSKFSKESQKRSEAAQLFSCDKPHSLFEQMLTLYAPNERELMRSLGRMQQAPEQKCAVFVKRIEAVQHFLQRYGSRNVAPHSDNLQSSTPAASA